MKNMSGKENKSDWFVESLHENYKLMVSLSSMIYQGKTNYQNVKIFQNDSLGKVLVLDEIIQLTEADEANYHEMMVHVPLFSATKVKKILIIGGADGGILREILKHPVYSVTLVDIDGEIINICKKYLPSISNNSFNDTRAKVIIDDGSNFVTKCSEKYDIIIIDSTDPFGPGEALFSKDFYKKISKILTPEGIAIFQGGVPFLQEEQFEKMNTHLNNAFSFYGFYFVTVPTYSGGSMAIGWGSNYLNLSCIDKNKIKEKVNKASLDLKYYNLSMHISSFGIPQNLRKIMLRTK
ncbi:MAG: spermidine synthase [Rhodospirillaceae bacterium]|nr:spermidine synthase [Rhodospirillaceae bacterium]|tara:strand:- start:1375 stop:2256 length:882 start_codon:yes stop_codon:yes gene_type:complete